MATIEVPDEFGILVAELAQRMGMPQADLIQQAVLEFAEDYADPRDVDDLAQRRDSGQVRIWSDEVRYRLGMGH